jgi:hypothetical protein
LPVAAIVDEKILCMHGGLSPELLNMEQVKRIMRPTDIPDTGLLCDLLWADPDKDIVGWGENDRGVSFTFGEDVVAQFLRRHDLDLICRAHQVSRCAAAGVCCCVFYCVVITASLAHWFQSLQRNQGCPTCTHVRTLRPV